MREIKFSVVIPLYNKHYSIESCVDSVLIQSFKSYEIIIVNDGSTDNSLEILNSNYKDEICSGVIKIIDQSNQGVSVARNNGIKASKSDYICLLDADDEWKSDFLENMNKLVKECPDAKMYFLQHEKNYNNLRVRVNKSAFPRDYIGIVDDFFKRSILSNIANSSKVCVKRDAIEYVSGFPIGEKSGEDIYVWMEIALNFPVAIYNKVSARTNMILDDGTRAERITSFPYPFTYYSDPKNIKKLTFWAKLYLYKIYLAHVVQSVRSREYNGFCIRVNSGRVLFPVSTFFLGICKHFIFLNKK